MIEKFMNLAIKQDKSSEKMYVITAFIIIIIVISNVIFDMYSSGITKKDLIATIMAISVPVLGIITIFVLKVPKKLQKYIEDKNYQVLDCTIVEVRNTMSDDEAIGTAVFNTGGKKVLIKTKDGKYCSNECLIDIEIINYFLEGNEPEVFLVNINKGYKYQLISKYKMKQI